MGVFRCGGFSDGRGCSGGGGGGFSGVGVGSGWVQVGEGSGSNGLGGGCSGGDIIEFFFHFSCQCGLPTEGRTLKKI